MTLGSPALDCQDPPELKVPTPLFFHNVKPVFEVVSCFFASTTTTTITAYLPLVSVLFVRAQDSQVSPVSQELLVDQADQEWMDVPASQGYLDLRWVQMDDK